MGPFQTANYNIAKICIECGVHYIDLADGREFVCNISNLNAAATSAKISVISGASTVPALSSAVIEQIKGEFSKITMLNYGISPGQKAERGLATTQGILTYIGKQIPAPKGSANIRYGWQDIHHITYPQLGKRWMANCEIPDFDLLPQKYNIKKMNFSAGMESSLLHLSIWSLSWLVRLGLPVKLANYAAPLLKISQLFDWLGTKDGGMHMIFNGLNLEGRPKSIKWYIIAKDGDGPQIPTVPTIIIAKKIMHDQFDYIGAMPCVGIVSLDECIQELDGFNIKTYQV